MKEELPSSLIIGAGVVGAGAVLASKDLLVKLLGPTADYLGIGTRDLVKKSVENLDRIFRAAYEKVKADADKNYQVNSRVLKTVWDGGRFVEDAVTTEYFAGILASSRTDDGKDDSALPFSSVLDAMSSHELRLHYILYSLVADGNYAAERNSSQLWNGLQIAIESNELLTSMGLVPPDGPSTLLMALKALAQHNLVNEDFSVDIGGIKEASGAKIVADQVVLYPNPYGASLFLRALGLKGIHSEVITSVDREYALSDDVKAAVQLPRHVKYSRLKVSDPVQTLAEEIENRLFDFESALDEMKDELQKKADTDPPDPDG